MSHNNLSISKSLPKESSSNPIPHKNPKSPSSSSPNNHQDPQQQKTLKCPRCNSPNTKFCYYNNYSLSQPRHFCKTCRRYWTRGGALRNVPVGGGCRKTKKSLKSSNDPNNPITSASCSSSASRFFMEDSRFFNGLLVSNSPLYPSLYDEENNNNNDNNNLQLASSSSSFGDPNCGSNLSLMGFNSFSIPNSGSVGTVENIASSIETLSSLNQDLHLKLQQQRMAMIFGHHQNQKEKINGPDHSIKPQPILFQNLEIDSSRKEGGSGDAISAAAAGTEWLFGNSAYVPGGNNVNNMPNHWNGTEAWNDLNQF